MRRVRQTIEFKPEAVQLMKRGQSIVVAAHRLCVVGLDNDVVDFASTLVDANYLGHLNDIWSDSWGSEGCGDHEPDPVGQAQRA